MCTKLFVKFTSPHHWIGHTLDGSIAIHTKVPYVLTIMMQRVRHHDFSYHRAFRYRIWRSLRCAWLYATTTPMTMARCSDCMCHNPCAHITLCIALVARCWRLALHCFQMRIPCSVAKLAGLLAISVCGIRDLVIECMVSTRPGKSSGKTIN